MRGTQEYSRNSLEHFLVLSAHQAVGPDGESIWAELDRRRESPTVFMHYFAFFDRGGHDKRLTRELSYPRGAWGVEVYSAGHILWRCGRCRNL